MPDIIWYPRDDTSDQSIINSTVINDEYDLHELPPLTGWALDVGAHIGSVTIPLAFDHPDLRILAIEALADNCEVLQQNVDANGLGDRITVLNRAIETFDGVTQVWSHFRNIEGTSDPFLYHNRFIGNIYNKPGKHPDAEYHVEDVEAVTLTSLLTEYGIDEVAYTKTDCEGGEWALFADPAVGRLLYIAGEYHDRTEDGLYEALHRTHEVTTFPAAEEHDSGIGLFVAVAL
jgi:FkbM family methyltransferase